MCFTDIRVKKFGEEKNDLEDQVRRLKLELEEERNKNRRIENGLDYEKQSKYGFCNCMNNVFICLLCFSHKFSRFLGLVCD